jgi:ribosome biogenesis protein UTP30
MTAVPNKPSARPQLIKIPHPFITKAENSRVCVFVKDPARAFKDQIEDMDLPCIAKVIGFDKLKRNFKQYKDKRLLVKDYDAFLADLRVYKMLPEVLGKEFYSKKMYPCPVKVHGFGGKELQQQLNNAAASTSFMQGNGPNYSLTVGRTTQAANDVALNVQQALAQAVSHLTCFEADRIGFKDIS